MTRFTDELGHHDVPVTLQRIYVAGPMRGYTLFNFPAFDEATTMLRAEGWSVVSPAEHDRQRGFNPAGKIVEGFYEGSMRWDIEQILQCDAMFMLQGWEGSQGASTEHAVAKSIGLRILYQTAKDTQRYEYRDHTAFQK